MTSRYYIEGVWMRAVVEMRAGAIWMRGSGVISEVLLFSKI